MARVRIGWSGVALEGPGVTTLYFDSSRSGWNQRLETMLNSLKTQFPTGVTWRMENSGDLIDSATGALVGAWTDGSGVTINCSAAGFYTRGVGFRNTWNTAAIVRNRHVRGSSFWAPCVAGVWGANGLMTTASNNAVQTALRNMVNGDPGALLVWSRPNNGTNGVASPVVDVALSENPSWLRSRRT